MSEDSSKPKKKLKVWQIVLIVFAFFALIGQFTEDNTDNSKTLSAEEQRQKASDELSAKYEVTPSWYPEGFDEYAGNPDVAWRWLKGSEFDCAFGDSCWGILLIAKYGCSSSLYAEISILDSSGVQISYSNDSLSTALPMQKNKMIFESFEPGADKARLARVNCV